MLEGLITPFTLSDGWTQSSSHFCRYRITVITSDFQSENLGSIPGTCSNKSYRSPNSADERNLGSHRIATFTGSLNVPRYSVMDPALMCTSTGDGEQTIGKIQTRGEHGRFIFFMGLMPTAGRLICNQIVWVRFPQCPPNKQLIGMNDERSFIRNLRVIES